MTEFNGGEFTVWLILTFNIYARTFLKQKWEQLPDLQLLTSNRTMAFSAKCARFYTWHVFVLFRMDHFKFHLLCWITFLSKNYLSGDFKHATHLNVSYAPFYRPINRNSDLDKRNSSLQKLRGVDSASQMCMFMPANIRTKLASDVNYLW